MTIARRRALIAMLLAAPTAAFANAIVPILNFFNRETWQPAALATLVIILVEAALLRWRIKTFPFLGTLWRVAVINLASSAAGSLVLAVAAGEAASPWGLGIWAAPLLLITFVTEIPLLHALFKPAFLSWGRAIGLGINVNLASYAAFFVFWMGVASFFISLGNHIDRREARTWRNPALAESTEGVFYGIGSDEHAQKLCRYRIKDMQYTALTNSPDLDPYCWDVEGSTCAFMNNGNTRFVVAQLPDFETLAETSLDAYADNVIPYASAVSVAVSPDESKVAILLRLSKKTIFGNDITSSGPSAACRLAILDVASGHITTISSRLFSASDLCWLPDSRRVIAVSFDDESRYKTADLGKFAPLRYFVGFDRYRGIGEALYVVDIASGATTRFADGESPSLAIAAGTILVSDEDGCRLLDSEGKTLRRIRDHRDRMMHALVSPTGDAILARFRRHKLYQYGGRLAIFGIDSPRTPHFLADGIMARVDWVLAKPPIHTSKDPESP